MRGVHCNEERLAISVRKRVPPRWQADAALASVALVWGSTFVFVKDALQDISTVYFLFLRFGFASLCMLAMFWPSLRRTPARAVRRGLAGGAITGLFLWLGYVFQSYGLKYTSAGNSGFLTGLYIVMVPFLGALWYRRLPRLVEVTGLLVATGGMVILSAPTLSATAGMNRGDVLTLVCALVFAVHLLVLGHFSKVENLQSVALGQIAVAALLSGVSLLWEHPVVVWRPGVVVAIVTTGLFATALAFALQTWGQRYTTPTRTALIFSLEPVFALLTAAAIGGEELTRYSIGGGCLVLAGIVLVEVKLPKNAGADAASSPERP
jgi:drug/metabolite transporter (DMT)-like permease